MIDWKFIAAREGKRLNGYVPEPRKSKSGVTIGCGVDIGHMTDDEFNLLPPTIQDKIEPYRHLTGLQALQKVRALPLMLPDEEVAILNQVMFDELSKELREDYDRATAEGSFDQLTDEQQTCIMSVSFQYGVLAAKTPRFWKLVTHRDWNGAIHELENFGDDYASRRKLEAELLKGLG